MNHHYNRLILWLVLVLTAITNSYSTNNTVTDSTTVGKYCPGLKRQSPLNLEQIMGKWYVVEVVKHKIEPKLINTGHETTTVKTCPVVKLKFVEPESDEEHSDTISLLWTEDAGDLEYLFHVPDLEKAPGLWNSEHPQNGTLVSQRYTQFFGPVQVVKATEPRMVLTFCSLVAKDQLFSIILSRTNHLQESFAMRVQNMLSRHGLTIDSVKETCINVESLAG